MSFVVLFVGLEVYFDPDKFLYVALKHHVLPFAVENHSMLCPRTSYEAKGQQGSKTTLQKQSYKS